MSYNSYYSATPPEQLPAVAAASVGAQQQVAMVHGNNSADPLLNRLSQRVSTNTNNHRQRFLLGVPAVPAAVEPVPPPPKIDPRVWETPPSRVAAMPNSPSRRHRADTSAGSPGSSSSASTSNRGSFECHICLTSKSSFQDKESLQMHWLVAHAQSLWHCVPCSDFGQTFASPEYATMKEHVVSKHSTPTGFHLWMKPPKDLRCYKCRMCTKVLFGTGKGELNVLAQHYSQVHNVNGANVRNVERYLKRFCRICGGIASDASGYPSDEAITTHIQVAHPASDFFKDDALVDHPEDPAEQQPQNPEDLEPFNLSLEDGEIVSQEVTTTTSRPHDDRRRPSPDTEVTLPAAPARRVSVVAAASTSPDAVDRLIRGIRSQSGGSASDNGRGESVKRTVRLCDNSPPSHSSSPSPLDLPAKMSIDSKQHKIFKQLEEKKAAAEESKKRRKRNYRSRSSSKSSSSSSSSDSSSSSSSDTSSRSRTKKKKKRKTKKRSSSDGSSIEMVGVKVKSGSVKKKPKKIKDDPKATASSARRKSRSPLPNTRGRSRSPSTRRRSRSPLSARGRSRTRSRTPSTSRRSRTPLSARARSRTRSRTPSTRRRSRSPLSARGRSRTISARGRSKSPPSARRKSRSPSFRRRSRSRSDSRRRSLSPASRSSRRRRRSSRSASRKRDSRSRSLTPPSSSRRRCSKSPSSNRTRRSRSRSRRRSPSRSKSRSRSLTRRYPRSRSRSNEGQTRPFSPRRKEADSTPPSLSTQYATKNERFRSAIGMIGSIGNKPAAKWHHDKPTTALAFSGPEVAWDSQRLDKMWGARVTVKETFCDLCNCPVSNVEHFTSKLHKSKKINKIRCLYCPKWISNSLHERMKHLAAKHADCGFKCGFPKCEVKRAEAQQMYMHFVDSHRKEIPERDVYDLSDMDYITRGYVIPPPDWSSYQCLECNEKFRSQALADVVLHQLTEDNMTRPDQKHIKFSCRLCNRSFDDQTEQLNHFKEHGRVIEEGGRHKVPSASSTNPVPPPPKKRKEPLHCCPFCEREFKSEPEVNSHALKEHQQSLFTCQDCPEDQPPFKAVEWSSMDSHLETKHGKVADQIKSAVMPEDFRALKCKECSRKWYSQAFDVKMLERHCQSEHGHSNVEGGFLLKCRLCKVSYTPAMSQKWSDHCANDHAPAIQVSKAETAKRTCVYCPRMFDRGEELANHKVEQHKASHFRCKWCVDAVFDTWRQLTKHLTSQHKTVEANFKVNAVLPDVLNQFTCRLCDVILFADSPVAHFRSKHPGIPDDAASVDMACRLCWSNVAPGEKANFKSLVDLRAHVAAHRVEPARVSPPPLVRLIKKEPLPPDENYKPISHQPTSNALPQTDGHCLDVSTSPEAVTKPAPAPIPKPSTEDKDQPSPSTLAVPAAPAAQKPQIGTKPSTVQDKVDGDNENSSPPLSRSASGAQKSPIKSTSSPTPKTSIQGQSDGDKKSPSPSSGRASASGTVRSSPAPFVDANSQNARGAGILMRKLLPHEKQFMAPSSVNNLMNYKFDCPYCPSVFKFVNQMSAHLKGSHWDKAFVCTKCNKFACSEKDQMSKHACGYVLEKGTTDAGGGDVVKAQWRFPEDVRHFKCLKCSATFIGQDFSVAQDHVVNRHCSKLMTSAEKMESAAKQVLASCLICCQRFETDKELLAHGQVCKLRVN